MGNETLGCRQQNLKSSDMDTTEDFYKQYFTDAWFRQFTPTEQKVTKVYFDKMMNEYADHIHKVSPKVDESKGSLSCVIKVVHSIGQGVSYRIISHELSKHRKVIILFTGTHEDCHKYMADNNLPQD